MVTILTVFCCIHLSLDVIHKLFLTAFIVLGSGLGFVNLKHLKYSKVLDLTDSIYIFWLISVAILFLYIVFLITLQCFLYQQSKTDNLQSTCVLICNRLIFAFYIIIYGASYISAFVLYIKVAEKRQEFGLDSSFVLHVYSQMVPNYYHPCLDTINEVISENCFCSNSKTWSFKGDFDQKFAINKLSEQFLLIK